MLTRLLVLLALPAAAAAAPLVLTPPQSGDFSSTATKPCGDLATPCQTALGQSNSSKGTVLWTPHSSGWTYGGSVSTGIAGVSGAKGPATVVAGSAWARSPDGELTVSLGVAHETFPGYGYGTVVPVTPGAGAFGHP